MWPGGSGGDVTVEVEVKPRLELEPLALHLDDVDFMVAFGLYHASRHYVFHSEVITDHQPLLVAGKPQVIGPG